MAECSTLCARRMAQNRSDLALLFVHYLILMLRMYCNGRELNRSRVRAKFLYFNGLRKIRSLGERRYLGRPVNF